MIKNYSKYIPHFTIFVLALVVYTMTMTGYVYVGDSGEFTSNAATLGINHTPGYPLHALLGRVFTILFFFLSTPAAVNLLSAFAAAATGIFLYESALLLTKEKFVSFFSTLMFLFSYTFWSRATIAEIYTLNALFVAIGMFFILKWYFEENDFYLIPLAFFAGLGLGQHITGAVFVLSILFLVAMKKYKIIFDMSLMRWIFLFFFIGVTVYLYLIYRSSSNAALVFSGEGRLKRMIQYIMPGVGITKKIFKTGGGWAHFGERLGWFAKDILTKEFWYFGVLGFIGIAALRKNKKLLLFLLSIILINVFNTVRGSLKLYADFDAHFIVAFFVWALFIAVGLKEIVSFLSEKGFSFLQSNYVKGIALAVFPIVILAANFSDNNKRGDDFADSLGRDLLAPLKKNAVLFTSEDEEYFLPRFFIQTENLRRDVEIKNNATLANYAKRAPGFQQRSNKEKEAIMLNVMKSLIEKKFKERPVYITFEQFPVQVLRDKYKIVPKGLVSRLVPLNERFDSAFTPVRINPAWAERHFDFREQSIAEYSYLSQFLYNAQNWIDLKVYENVLKEIDRFENFPVKTETRDKYRQAYLLKGKALLELRRLDEAEKEIKKALEIKPGDRFGEEFLGDIFIAKKDSASAIEHWKKSLSANAKNSKLQTKLDSVSLMFNKN
ncbi:MAG: DUF2723 domain-containing protein [Chlorobi bacterium]|nr:DUF2723 domain-containing protein [Chlorobiota bacterium]